MEDFLKQYRNHSIFILRQAHLYNQKGILTAYNTAAIAAQAVVVVSPNQFRDVSN